MADSTNTYSQGHADSVLRSHRWRTAENSASYLLPELRHGLDILDVGCGPGTITADFARLVAPGRVLGIDPSESVLDQARETAAELGVDNVRFDAGDIHTVALDDDSYDVVHAHQVLQHLQHPVSALREMLRIARPGGVVAIRETDYAGMVWWPADSRLDRWLEIYRAVAHDSGGEPNAGRRLLSWARAAGATDITPTASIWCHASPNDRAWWGGMWAERIVQSRIADRALAAGHADRAELEDISAAWHEWSQDPDGWFSIPHGEIRCRA